MTDHKPWWWPERIDDQFLVRLREDYTDHGRKTDKELLDCFCDGRGRGQFVTTWDHICDAYGEYEELANAFLRLCEETGRSPGDFLVKK